MKTIRRAIAFYLSDRGHVGLAMKFYSLEESKEAIEEALEKMKKENPEVYLLAKSLKDNFELDIQKKQKEYLKEELKKLKTK